MATVVLQVAGAALGSVFGPVGAIIGRAAGGLAGAAIDNALLGGGATGSGAARLKDLDVTASTEGTPIPRAWGRVRLAGQIIWATRLDSVTSQRSSGGKGGGSSQTTETISYYANVALGICEGKVARIGRVWADGKPLDLTGITMRVHDGDEDQNPDPLIVAKEDAGNAPAYRGLAYVVFERMPLEKFGNRVPQLAFEVIRPVGALEEMVRSVCLIPGSTEFGYDDREVIRQSGIAESIPENRNSGLAETDIEASLDELEALCPNLEHVSLVVAWFGDDLRCGHCTIAPRIDNRDKETSGATWRVAGLGRGAAREVSRHEGRAAYGGSPSDESVIRAIRHIKARGLKVTLYPFLMMDIPAGNHLPDPRTGVAPQPAYPWRGEISAASDGEAGAVGEVADFFGGARARDFSVGSNAVDYDGPNEWSWRRFVLHLAHLGKAAGGVDAVLIGSEFRSLTRVRDGAGAYPAVAELVSLAGEVREAVGSATRITYAADWTEYGSHVPAEGEVRFPLDPLWASEVLDAVGIDWYAPLADWRDGREHLDRATSESICDPEYLAANVAGGENFDWYYADEGARAAQIRTPVMDGLGKEWTFRAKDLAGWWANAHYERSGGIELSEPTAWVPGSKPIWLTEIGCPAVDKGANAPNVFPDTKAAIPNLPHFSSGGRDDLVQRRALQALMSVYGSDVATNPLSDIYDGPMVDAGRTALWAWDARPFPAFPDAIDVWSDGAAHATGHWLTGRLGQAPLAELSAAILADSGAESFETSRLEGVIDGYAIDRPASAREALEPLAELFGFGAVERDGAIVLTPRGRGMVRSFTNDDLAVDGEGAEPNFVRSQESELPAGLAIGFADVSADFRPRVASAQKRGGVAQGIATRDTAIVSAAAEMRRRADIGLQDVWIGRETARFAIGPTEMAVEPGDLIALDDAGSGRTFEVAEIADGLVRRISARAIAPEIFDAPRPAESRGVHARPVVAGPPRVELLDLPAPEGEPPVLTRIAIAAKPWPGGFVAWRENGGTFEPALRVSAPAIIGTLLGDLPTGPVWRFDRGSSVEVRISGGQLIGATEDRLLGGANAAAIRAPDGAWEVLQFGRADLVAPLTYRLSGFLRGQAGTEQEASLIKPAGSVFVLLDAAILPLVRGIEHLGRPVLWRVAAAGRDHADRHAVEVTAEPEIMALRPYSPVHLHAVRTGDGIAIRWVRRTRTGGDAWDAAEVPLGEEAESYRVEILDGAGIARTMNVSAPEALYAAADEIADFGAAQASLSVRVTQVSASVGPGRAAEGIFDV